MKTKLLQKTTVIGGIGSPVKLISRETTTATKLLVTYGGGIGGANVTYYGNVKFSSQEGNLLLIDDIVNGEIKVNLDYVVTREQIQLIVELWDTTDRTNYNGATCTKSIQQRILAVGTKYKIVFDEKQSGVGHATIVDTYDEIVK